MWLRHLASIALFPFTVTVIVPLWIARSSGVAPAIASSPAGLAAQCAGAAALGLGLVLFVASLRRFAGDGQGTLAPWDPPRRLVVRGPYRFVRNPMISGVFFVVAGEALLLQSWPHAAWTGAFLLLNMTYIPLVEEPGLRARFGEPYREYARHVPRVWPRLTPWHGPLEKER